MKHNLPCPFPMIAILGPTAIGKTGIALRLAAEIKGEIINFDSIQVYKGLDIGSAKPTKDEMATIPHHLIDILEPDEPFDAAMFAARAQMTIRSIKLKGKIAILTGGTNLYLRALIEGLAPCQGEDRALRTRLKRILMESGREKLYRFLATIDPKTAARLHPNDSFRVIRAIEIYILTGQPLSMWHEIHRNNTKIRPYCIKIGLIRPIDELYTKIDRRVDKMINAGLVDEVRRLLAMGFDPRLKPLQSLGYRHIIRFLAGEVSFADTIRQLKMDHRRYARRQLIWLRKEPGVKWFHPDDLVRRGKIWPAISGG
ncbi:MAG: tRNA (adenosine(37)-N6)-dimethylallyltransferase MiaA [Dissulfurimicrobium sp.]|uniref:tRNA (adenosine(37)-N6)-dimethylallyltransferase MiaA n=2 Tax=Dissulfurimicrobium TaxID=1769732 RepID=UPI001EDC8E80|nr:tRNA (adenosine(37)-N6)-dimethylallyltransferase MiaA [Dissulfurimicrobium hydrothermale]UKL13392.1 tRNA (adenosine(37)-N6)-dimethylallyltransferase MiaA [Dissulfurimicrobium hydrothermale]